MPMLKSTLLDLATMATVLDSALNHKAFRTVTACSCGCGAKGVKCRVCKGGDLEGDGIVRHKPDCPIKAIERVVDSLREVRP